MSEQRRPMWNLLLRIPGKKATKVEAFDAMDFIGQAAHAAPGLLRLRVDGRWLGEGGYVFYGPEELWLELEVRLGLALAPPPPQPPALAKGDWVRVYLGERNGVPIHERMYLASDPMQDVCGSWHVLCSTYSRGRVMVPVADVTLCDKKP